MSSADISPSLLKAIMRDFKRYCDKSDKLLTIMKKIEKGNATHSDIYKYAEEIGCYLSRAYQNNISSEILPDGKMYWNIAKSVIEPTLTTNYTIVNNVAMSVQDIINKEANIGIKSMKSTLNTDRIEGFMNKMANADKFDDVSYLLDEPIVNFTLNVVDDFIRENAELHNKAGLNPVIIRTAQSKCCKWCSKLAGTYDYDEVSNKGNNIFRRHENCRCLVVFKDDKYIQNVHSKKEYTKEEIEEVLKDNKYDCKKSSKYKTPLPKNVEDNTSYFLNNLKLGNKKSDIRIEKGVDIKSHQNEINVAKWLKEKFGGDIKIVKELQGQYQKNYDYIWNGIPWELKSLKSFKQIDKRIRKGCNQVTYNNNKIGGGIIVDISRLKESDDKIIAEILKSFPKRAKGNHDLIIKRGDKLIKVFSFRK